MLFLAGLCFHADVAVSQCTSIQARTVPGNDGAHSYTSWHRDFGRAGQGHQWNFPFDRAPLQLAMAKTKALTVTRLRRSDPVRGREAVPQRVRDDRGPGPDVRAMITGVRLAVAHASALQSGRTRESPTARGPTRQRRDLHGRGHHGRGLGHDGRRATPGWKGWRRDARRHSVSIPSLIYLLHQSPAG